jgi:hypothetical protein
LPNETLPPNNWIQSSKNPNFENEIMSWEEENNHFKQTIGAITKKKQK